MEHNNSIINEAVQVYNKLDGVITFEVEIMGSNLSPETRSGFPGDMLLTITVPKPEVEFQWFSLVNMNNNVIILTAKVKLQDITRNTNLGFFDFHDDTATLRYSYAPKDDKEESTRYFKLINHDSYSFFTTPLPPLIDGKYHINPVSEVISRAMSDIIKQAVKTGYLNIYNSHADTRGIASRALTNVNIAFGVSGSADISGNKLGLLDIMPVRTHRKVRIEGLIPVGWILDNDELSKQNRYGMYNKIFIIFRLDANFLGSEFENSVKSDVTNDIGADRRPGGDPIQEMARKLVTMTLKSEDFLRNNDLIVGEFVYEYSLRSTIYKIPKECLDNITETMNYINTIHPNGYYEIAMGKKIKAAY